MTTTTDDLSTTEATEEARPMDTPTGGLNNPETPEAEPETFPRDVVEKLREEAAGYRVKAKDRDDLAHRLHVALVAATGRLADPTDLAFDETHIADDEALTAALDDLLTRKPHLATRRPTGSVGQGATPTTAGTDLAGLLRSRA